MARFCPLFSGSSGNSYYIGSSGSGVLIDAGRSAKQITNMLGSCEIDIASVKAIFVTHEHSDHVKGLRVFASRHHIPVFASVGTLKALEKMGCLNEKYPADVIDENGMECAGMYIKPFRTSHDCAEGLGYRIETQDGRSAGFSTDLGYFSEAVKKELLGTDLVVLESNPYYLKQRILSNIGHLSNQACADQLFELAKKGTTRFVLAHLSSENNTPELAYQTSLCSLSLAGLKEGVDYQLYVAPKENVNSKVMIF